MTAALISRPTIAAGQLIRRGFSWWLSELLHMAPPRLLHLFGHSASPATVLELGSTRITLILPARGRRNPLVVPLSDYPDQELRQHVQSVIRRHHTDDEVTIKLDRALIFEASLELPLSAESSLRPILQHQIERLVPLAAADICFAHRISARALGSKKLTVKLIAVKRTTIEAALALARTAGLSPRGVVATGADIRANSVGSNSPFILWQAGRGAAESDARRRVRRTLEITAAVLLLSAYGLHVHRLDQLRDDLQLHVAEAEQTATAVTQLGRKSTDISSALVFLESKRKGASPLQVLNELTRLIPNDSWVTQLVMRGRSVEVIGYSPRATDLIVRVEGSALFEKPQFRSPITLSPDGREERFDLTFDIKAERGQ